VFNAVERIIKPQRLASITTAVVSDWLAKLQEGGRAAATAGIYGRVLRAALNWAIEQKLIANAPKFRIPKKQSGTSLAKGRPLCGEEHDRMKAAVGKVLKHHVEAWQSFLDALWHSGFRLGEALALSWDSSAAVTAIVIEGRRPVVRFRANGQKARRDEIWPCPPEFAAMLEAVPEAERMGQVFKLPKRRSFPPGQTTVEKAGKIIAEIGEKAGIITGDTENDFATAHAYRRSFGTRWSKRVMPAVLKRLMRHANIKTTMEYYVDQDADSIADDLWQRFGNGNTSGNKAPENLPVS
jgi:integrase